MNRRTGWNTKCNTNPVTLFLEHKVKLIALVSEALLIEVNGKIDIPTKVLLYSLILIYGPILNDRLSPSPPPAPSAPWAGPPPESAGRSSPWERQTLKKLSLLPHLHQGPWTFQSLCWHSREQYLHKQLHLLVLDKQPFVCLCIALL